MPSTRRTLTFEKVLLRHYTTTLSVLAHQIGIDCFLSDRKTKRRKIATFGDPCITKLSQTSSVNERRVNNQGGLRGLQVRRTICRTNSRLCFTPDGKTILAGGGIPVMVRLPAFPKHRVSTMAVWQYSSMAVWRFGALVAAYQRAPQLPTYRCHV